MLFQKIQAETQEVENLQDNIDRAISAVEDKLERSMGAPSKEKVATYTAKFGQVVLADPTTAGFTVMLPLAGRQDEGKTVIVKNFGGSTNTITIVAQSGETIDGAATDTITSAWGVVRLMVAKYKKWVTI